MTLPWQNTLVALFSALSVLSDENDYYYHIANLLHNWEQCFAIIEIDNLSLLELCQDIVRISDG